MQTIQIVFSPTGGTAAAANAVTAAWPGTPRVIDLADPTFRAADAAIAEDDLVLVAMPSFGGRAPKTAIRRLEEIQGNGAQCALLCVYGNRAYEDTLTEMSDAALRCGFLVIAACTAVAQHSIVPSVAAGRPDTDDVQELTSFGQQVWQKYEAGAHESISETLPGHRPYKKSGGLPITPRAMRNCNGCGTCAKHCPVQAIDKTHPRKAQSRSCITCMRCVSVCPRGARRINGAMQKLAEAALKKAAAGRRKNELYL